MSLYRQDGKSILLIHVDDDGPGLDEAERVDALKRGVRLDEKGAGDRSRVVYCYRACWYAHRWSDAGSQPGRWFASNTSFAVGMSGVWIFLLGIAGVLLVSVWLGRETLRHGIIVAVAGLSGLVAYALAGSPSVADMPYLKRQAEISEIEPGEMNLAETLSRLGHLAQTRSDDPQPHVFIGDLMKSQRRFEEAIRAYQSALRRDDAFIPALTGLADTLTQQDNGQISEQTLKHLCAGFQSR